MREVCKRCGRGWVLVGEGVCHGIGRANVESLINGYPYLYVDYRELTPTTKPNLTTPTERTKR